MHGLSVLYHGCEHKTTDAYKLQINTKKQIYHFVVHSFVGIITYQQFDLDIVMNNKKIFSSSGIFLITVFVISCFWTFYFSKDTGKMNFAGLKRSKTFLDFRYYILYPITRIVLSLIVKSYKPSPTSTVLSLF